MTIKEIIKDFFKRLFRHKSSAKVQDAIIIEETDIDVVEEETQKKFALRNIIMEKIDYLEQYIKIFSLTFPKEYQQYLSLIQSERKSYENELKSYMNGFNGNMTFSIDPEQETQRLMAVTALEKKITDFVELDMNYHIHKEKFSKLCVKLNIFYNALIDTKRTVSEVKNQLQNANNSLLKLIQDVETMTFFESDSRKKRTF